jgi:hypothetical protein
MAKNLTKRDPSTGEITQAGLAVGTSENVLHSESILIYFFLLNGLDNEDLMTSSTEANILEQKRRLHFEHMPLSQIPRQVHGLQVLKRI